MCSQATKASLKFNENARENDRRTSGTFPCLFSSLIAAIVIAEAISLRVTIHDLYHRRFLGSPSKIE